jgi:asparaginyl-tRNA synthetase
MPHSLQNILRPLHCRSFASCAVRYNASLPRTIRQVVEAASKNEHSAANDTAVSVNGWIKSVRRQKNVAFAQLSDGTDLEGRGLQVVFENPALADRYVLLLIFQGSSEITSVIRESHSLTMGTSVKVQGRMVKSLGKGQNFELAAKSIEILGRCDAEVCLLNLDANL